MAFVKIMLSYNETECHRQGTLVSCINNPVLWVATISTSLIILFYIYRIYKAFLQIRRTSLQDALPSILFWISIILAPSVLLCQYIFLNRWTSQALKFVFLVLRPNFIVLPYITISFVILKLGRQLHTSNSEKDHYVRNSVLLGLMFLALFGVEILILFLQDEDKNLYSLNYVNLFIYLFCIFSFAIIALRMIAQIQAIQISDLAPNFLLVSVSGFHVIIIFNVFHLFIHTSIYAWMNFGGIRYTILVAEHFNLFTSAQLVQDLLGSLLPSLVLSCGVIYFNKSSTQAEYTSIDLQ